MDSITSLSELLSEQRPSSHVEIPGVLGSTFGQATLATTLPMSKLFSVYEVDLEVQRNIIPRNLSKLIDYINLYLDNRQAIYFPGIIFSARGAGMYDDRSRTLRPTVTLEMAKGFTLFMVKAVMSGRADELIDLAKTNLWR